MSPRAAWRLESLGFGEVYDYAPGKADWFAWGLPREGSSAAVPRVGDLARRDVPTCGLGEAIGAVRDRTHAAGWGECVVTNDRRIVLGLLRGDDLDADPGATAEDVMRPGPTTYKPDTGAAEAGRRMRERGVRALLVATPDGALVGLLRREDAVRRPPAVGGPGDIPPPPRVRRGRGPDAGGEREGAGLYRGYGRRAPGGVAHRGRAHRVPLPGAAAVTLPY